MALLGVWDPNKVYYGEWIVAPGTDPDYPDGLANPNGGADEVLFYGARWKASFYSQGANPLLNDPNDGTEWVQVGGTVNYAAVKPEAPLHLDVARVSDGSATLFWDLAEVKGAGGVTHYNVFVDGVKVGTTHGTGFTVNGLDAGTEYHFTVKAVNFVGSSSASVSATGVTNGDEILSDKTYSPYIDMTLPHVDLVDLARESGVQDFTLAFMQSNRTYLDDDGNLDLQAGEVPGIEWGGIERTTLATGVIAAQVEMIEKLGGTVTVAFGGYTGREAAVIAHQYMTYLDEEKGLTAAQAEAKALKNLVANYQSVIDTYGVDHLDFDIENAAYHYDEPAGTPLYPVVNDTVANHLRNLAINKLEKANGDLHISFTLPVTVKGFNSDPAKAGGDVLRVLEQAKADGVHIDLVNIMAMDYFDGDAEDMGQKAIDAANAVHKQLIKLGIDAKVGIVPMIGVNDNVEEIFTTEDAAQVLAFAKSHDWVGNIGIWQLPRDRPSDLLDEDTGTTAKPISTGSGLADQDPWEFSDIFGGVTRQATAGKDVITGNSDGNLLRGLAGNDTINGNGGNDTVQGGLGKDRLNGGDGLHDVLDFSDKTTSVVLTLSGATEVYAKVNGVDEDRFRNFEDVVGGSAADTLTGDNAANNFTGGGGKDVIVGAGGADHFFFTLKPSSSNIDTIDFKHDEDIIELSSAFFGKIGPTVTSGEVVVVASGSEGTQSNDYLVYNKTSGKLYYDADGAGGAASVQIALLSTKPALIDSGDFHIV